MLVAWISSLKLASSCLCMEFLRKFMNYNPPSDGNLLARSSDCRENKKLVKQLSSPIPGSKDLHFPTRFPQNGWEQLKACLWKQNLSYWRSPSYNLMRFLFMSASSVLFGLLFWQKGNKMLDITFSLMLSKTTQILSLRILFCL